jgi:flagellar motor switch protein FliG
LKLEPYDMNASKQDLSDAGLRKAAILVACLDSAAADAVLEQLTPEQSRQIRQAVVVLEEIPMNEEQFVVNEFFRLGPRKSDTRGVELELSSRVAGQIGQKSPASVGDKTASSARQSKPFVRLREAEDEKLARLLAGERPQTIALVLSRLSARQAGGVLARLQPNLQTEVIRRLVDLEETDPAILQEVEQALESRLSQQVRMQRRRVAGLDAINGILDASETGVRMQILENLSSHDQSMAERLNPTSMEFDELIELDVAALAEVFRAAEPQWIMPALLGAPAEITNRVLRFLPRAQAETLRRKLANPGPIRISDVETARQRIAEIAARMMYAREGFRVQSSGFRS